MTDKVRGFIITLEENIIMDILWPAQPLDDWADDVNDISVISKLSYNNIDFLLTGDLTSNAEKEILNQDLDSEFLKVGHHGSRYSSNKEFLKQVKLLKLICLPRQPIDTVIWWLV